MKNLYIIFSSITSNFQSLSLLFIRFGLAYGFYETAIMKWHNLESTAEWFASMGFILPTLSVYFVAIFEILAVPLFILGLFSRILSIPLLVIILVAIFAVHFSNGFSAGNNGFEIPLYYGIMLFTLFAFGSGKFSIDYLIFRK
ncbi:DoxX family protein [Helicobacter sp. 16-1353]|uniref:DoxX family protein n=1 Tax=Helicobacter sp. 16-1353 TaxID=2004996 RepID=UPI000DCC8AC6|nr:DoxX family protein [Helicobacter sp. 16-1353]RAX55250.1 DoxX family protein [Helicobacter sp. 16-1353]